MESKTDCRTKEGIIVGLIDSMITIARVLKGYKIDLHDQESKAIAEAMKDLRMDDDVNWLVTMKTYKEQNVDRAVINQIIEDFKKTGKTITI